MSETSRSLLDRLQSQDQPNAWQSLIDVYAPMIRNWLARYGVHGADADDCLQEVLTVLIRRVPEFRRERLGSFRRWLRTITVNCLRDHARREGKHPRPGGGSEYRAAIEQLASDESGMSRQWDAEHRQMLIDWLLEKIRPEFQESTWQAFRGTAIEGRKAAEVAAQCGLTVNAVFIAKSRVLSRLREEGQGLIE